MITLGAHYNMIDVTKVWSDVGVLVSTYKGYNSTHYGLITPIKGNKVAVVIFKK